MPTGDVLAHYLENGVIENRGIFDPLCGNWWSWLGCGQLATKGVGASVHQRVFEDSWKLAEEYIQWWFWNLVELVVALKFIHARETNKLFQAWNHCSGELGKLKHPSIPTIEAAPVRYHKSSARVQPCRSSALTSSFPEISLRPTKRIREMWTWKQWTTSAVEHVRTFWKRETWFIITRAYMLNLRWCCNCILYI